MSDELIKQVLESGQLTSSKFEGGKYVQLLEKKVCNYTKAEHCIAVSSGTGALHTVLECLDADIIGIPAFTFIATKNAVLASHKKIEYIDINRNDFTISTQDLKNKNIDAVIPVHLYGHPCDIDGVLDSCPIVIEDACQALGTFYKEKHLGTFGLAGCFSLYATKVVSSGEGGLIVTNDSKFAKKCREFRNQGSDEHFGLNYRLSEIHACLAIAQLERIDDIIKNRKAIYEKLIGEYPPYIQIKDGERWNYYLHTILGDKSLGTRYYEKPLANLPNAVWASQNVVSITDNHT